MSSLLIVPQNSLSTGYVSMIPILSFSHAQTNFSSVKTRIQAASSEDAKGKGKEGPKRSIGSLLVHILKTEGIAGFYKGFGASMLNTFSMRE